MLSKRISDDIQKEFESNFGTSIREYRQKNNITQNRLGEILNLTAKTISKYENGKIIPNADIIINILSTLKLDIKDVLPTKYYYFDKNFIKK